MNLLDLFDDFGTQGARYLLLALDGWTDAGRGGTGAAEHLRRLYSAEVLGEFDGDRLFDYRDRRPLLPIDRGVLGEPEWPAITLYRLDVPGHPVLLLEGAEPDFRWPSLIDDVVSLMELGGIPAYVGLGAVPGPAPHTRPVRVTTTSSDPDLLDRYGMPHEHIVVPASCQVMIEAALKDAGFQTLGLWARVPHYVAGEYPAASAELLRRLGDHVGVEFDVAVLDTEAAEHGTRLDEAAESSPEVRAHIEALEMAYDTDTENDEPEPFRGPLPTGDQIAAELERFLRSQAGD
jgi:hypothetical protein